jgi:hypothetical protein
VSSFNKTILPCHAPIAGALQNTLVARSTLVERSEPAGATQLFRTERAINPRESLCAEICFIKGHPVVRLTRVKRTAAGREKRTGSCFEFGTHRCGDVASLIADIERALGGANAA